MRKFLKTQVSLRIFLTLSLLVLTNCKGGPIPKWDGKIYAGTSARGGIERAQSSEFIAASDPLFDQYMAMSYEDFRKLYATYVLNCKQWKADQPMMSPQETYQVFKMGMYDLEHAKQ